MGVTSRISGAARGFASGLRGDPSVANSSLRDFEDMSWKVVKTRNWSDRQEAIGRINEFFEDGRTLEAAHEMLKNAELFFGAANKGAWSEILAAMNYLIFVCEVYPLGEICRGDYELYRYVVTGGRFGGESVEEQTGDVFREPEVMDEIKKKLEKISDVQRSYVRYYDAVIKMAIRQMLAYVREEHINPKPIIVIGGPLQPPQPPLPTVDSRYPMLPPPADGAK